MSDRPDTLPADRLETNGPPPSLRSSAVARYERKLAELELKIARTKRRIRDESVREQSVREGTVGRAMMSLIEQGVLEPAALALVREEVHKVLTPARARAFIGTPFELPTMPVGTVQEDVATPVAEPDISPVKRSSTTLFGLPRPVPK
jgi:hypothetical protein